MPRSRVKGAGIKSQTQKPPPGVRGYPKKKVPPQGQRLDYPGATRQTQAKNEKGTVGRVTPKKTGLFGSATLKPKAKPKAEPFLTTAKAVRSKTVSVPKAIKAGGVTKEKQTGSAKYAIRRQTRKAISQGMTPGSKKGGLGITKDEGGKTLQNAVGTLGYKKARKLVGRVVSNRTSKAQPRKGRKA